MDATQYLTTAERLARLADSMRQPALVKFVWRQLLTKQERERVTKSPTIGPDIVDIWSKLRCLSEEQALVDLARKCNLLWPEEDERLLRDIGQPVEACGQMKRPKPRFDEGGVLWLGDRIIRRIQLRHSFPTRIEQLLRAFQNQRWKAQIASPFSKDAQYVHKAVEFANRSLSGIRFSVSRSGTVVSWTYR